MRVIDTLRRLLRSLSLLDHGDLVAQVNQRLDVLVEHFLGEAYVQPFIFALVAHPCQIKQSIAHNSICVEHFVEFSQLKEDDFVEVFLLYLPVLGEGAREFLPFTWWHVKSRRIVLWV